MGLISKNLSFTFRGFHVFHMSVKSSLALLAFVISTLTASAQWRTQTFLLQEGWNAIFTHVDVSHQSLSGWIGSDESSPIEEVWLWSPEVSTLQFFESPQSPMNSGTQWATWKRDNDPAANTLAHLIGNQAYLVKIDNGNSPYNWTVQGKPVPPVERWTSSGMNFLGFSTHPDTPPSFEDFLANAPRLRQESEIFKYTGGEFSAGNPAEIFALRNTDVNRGEAFWVRSGDYFNRYFGTFSVSLQNLSGVRFGTDISQFRIRLRNNNSDSLTINLNLAASESAPDGQDPIVALPVLLLRGDLNTTDLTYDHTVINTTPPSWTLAPAGEVGSEVEVILGLNRSSLAGSAGDLFAGILEFTDSLGDMQVDVPVSARIASVAGLWVGEAQVGQVQHRLTTYLKDQDGNVVQNESGEYVADSTDNSFGGVAESFPLRLILHVSEGGEIKLLQQVFHGLDSEANLILCAHESLLEDGFLESARRITAVHLPWSNTNNGWPVTGVLANGQILAATVDLAHDDQASNPFLHTYHPDHDNLDSNFRQSQPRGVESYGVSRLITWDVKSIGEDFETLTQSSRTFVGEYSEVLTFKSLGTETSEYQVKGLFGLTRISDIGELSVAD